MEEEEVQKGLFIRGKDWFARAFCEREIILRARDEVHYVRLGRGRQVGLVTIAAVTMCATVALGVQTWRQARIIASKDDKIQHQEAAYSDLRGDVWKYHDKFQDLTRSLEDNQAYLLGVMEKNKTLNKDLADVQNTLKSAEVDRAEVAVAREALRKRLNHFEGDLLATADENLQLEARLANTRQLLEDTQSEREELLAARDLLRRRLEQFRGKTESLDAENDDLRKTISGLREELSDTRESLTAELSDTRSRLERQLSETAATYEKQLSETREILSARLEETQEDRDSLTEARDSLKTALAGAETELESAFEDKDQLHASLAEVHEQLVMMESSQDALEADRDLLASQLGDLQASLKTSFRHNTLVEQQLEAIEAALHGALQERGEIAAEKRNLQKNLEAMEERIAEFNNSQQEMVERLIDRAGTNMAFVERTIARTGANLDTLIAKVSRTDTGQGGPFVAAVEGMELPEAYEKTVMRLSNKLDRWDGLREVLQIVPLTAPVDSYRISSVYGKRKDPFNGRPAMHYGLDLAAKLRSPVYATSGGKVTFAGWKGNYGRLIEIDHGLGIKTRYAHLHKILVKRGQTVKFRKKIGLLGNSGRSTAAHLHYEVIIDKKTYDPMKFVLAGRHVFKE